LPPEFQALWARTCWRREPLRCVASPWATTPAPHASPRWWPRTSTGSTPTPAWTKPPSVCATAPRDTWKELEEGGDGHRNASGFLPAMLPIK